MSKSTKPPVKPEEVAIKVSNVSKTFKLPHEKQTSVKGLFLNVFNGKRTYEKQQVLNDISFEVKKGEFFGVVGRNGSGKSTLLKLLAGIYTPDQGHIQVNGKLVPFIELGVGFNPELSGRENVFLNGALLGFNRKKMLEMYDEIVEFAELEQFMDQKLKNYSSGMQVRLAFSIAIRAKADILVLDEVLAVGDEAFQRKCNDYFSEVKSKGKTVILVTHSMEAVRKHCDRAMFIRDGEIVSSGDPEDVANEYSLENLRAISSAHAAEGSKDIIKGYEISSTQKQILTSEDTLEVQIRFENVSSQEISKIRVGLHMVDNGQWRLTIDEKTGLKLGNGKHLYRYRLPLKNFNNGDYFIASSVWNMKDERITWVPESGRFYFLIRNKKSIDNESIFREKGEWVDQ